MSYKEYIDIAEEAKEKQIERIKEILEDRNFEILGVNTEGYVIFYVKYGMYSKGC